MSTNTQGQPDIVTHKTNIWNMVYYCKHTFFTLVLSNVYRDTIVYPDPVIVDAGLHREVAEQVHKLRGFSSVARQLRPQPPEYVDHDCPEVVF